jgi:glycerophosphoryl diester phosphodiesterase
MAAFRVARDMGADGIELHVYVTKDRELVVIHDYAVDRTTGVLPTPRRLDDAGTVRHRRPRNRTGNRQHHAPNP